MNNDTNHGATAPILVTGTPGWLGSRLAAHLAGAVPDAPVQPWAGHPIRCLALPDADTRDLERLPGVTIVRGDVTKADTLAPFMADARGSVLFHCAGIIHPKGAADFQRVNHTGTANVVAAAMSAGLRRLVHVSSNSPFGANPSRDHRFTEQSPYNPYMGYGRSKMDAELAVRAAASRLETVIIRAPWFYGPGQPPRQTQFFTMIKKGGFPLLGDGGHMRSMAYVDNLCQGLLLGGSHEQAAGQSYWIADARPYSMNEIVDTVEAVMAKDFGIAVSGKRMRVPSILGDMARLGDRVMQSVGLYDQRVHVLSEMNLTIACSVEKAVHDLGYAPAVSLEEGMRRSIAWVLAQGMSI